MDGAESFLQISFLCMHSFTLKKKLRIICIENEQLYREIRVLSVLDFLHIQLLSEYIIRIIVLQMHFGVDIYQQNNQ